MEKQLPERERICRLYGRYVFYSGTRDCVFIWNPWHKISAKYNKIDRFSFFLHPGILDNGTCSLFWRSSDVKMTSYATIVHLFDCTRFFHMTAIVNVRLRWKIPKCTLWVFNSKKKLCLIGSTVKFTKNTYFIIELNSYESSCYSISHPGYHHPYLIRITK